MSVKQITFRPWIWAALLVSLLGSAVADAAVQARLSQNRAYVGDPLVLTLSSDTAGGGIQPDLSPLQRDFQVLGSGTSSQFSFINGRRSSRTEWQVRLLPRRSGELTIPALQVGAERSEPLTLTVTDTPPPNAAETARHLFVEAELDPEVQEPYVQQQLTYTVRLFYDRAVLDGELTDLALANAVIERLGEDRRYAATRNGRQYQVLERRYAIFPQQSGTLEIPAMRFQGRLAGQDGGDNLQPRAGGTMQRFLQGGPFANDPFFRGGGFGNDPFAGMLGDSGRPVRAFGPALTVTVRPRPAGQGVWLPAQAVRLHDSWADGPPRLRVGEPVSRTITVEADGLSGAQIPALELPAPPRLRTYPEPLKHISRNDGDRLVGVSRQTLTYIPNAAGELELPPVRLVWWDTVKEEAAETNLPAWRLSVVAGAGGQTAPAEPPPAAAPAAVAPPSQPGAGVDVPHQGWGDAVAAHWPWWAAGLAGLAAVLAVPALRRRRRSAPARPAVASAPASAPVPPSPAPRVDKAEQMRTLEAACREQDGAAAARALLALAALRWPEDRPLNLSALAARLASGSEAIHALERHLYGAGDWAPEALWAAVKDGLVERSESPPEEPESGLPPLYRQRA